MAGMIVWGIVLVIGIVGQAVAIHWHSVTISATVAAVIADTELSNDDESKKMLKITMRLLGIPIILTTAMICAGVIGELVCIGGLAA